MKNNTSVRPMKSSDISDVLYVQRQTFTPDLCEDRKVFENRFELFGKYFKTAVLDEKIVGYLICFPWKLGETPINNQKFPKELPLFDCFYLHDITLLKEVRGLGLAREMIDAAKSNGVELGFQALCLVSVEQSGDYWDKLGFTALTQLSSGKEAMIQKIYGKKARLMMIDLY